MVGLPVPIRLAVSSPGDRMIATAIVSPNARPRPSMVAPITPGFPKGRTAVRIISHLVAPSARAASSYSRGVCRKTSRDTDVMIGRIITASTSEAVISVRPVADALSKKGRKPRLSSSHWNSGTRAGANTCRPHIPNTTEGTAASRSITNPITRPVRRSA